MRLLKMQREGLRMLDWFKRKKKGASGRSGYAFDEIDRELAGLKTAIKLKEIRDLRRELKDKPNSAGSMSGTRSSIRSLKTDLQDIKEIANELGYGTDGGSGEGDSDMLKLVMSYLAQQQQAHLPPQDVEDAVLKQSGVIPNSKKKRKR